MEVFRKLMVAGFLFFNAYANLTATFEELRLVLTGFPRRSAGAGAVRWWRGAARFRRGGRPAMNGKHGTAEQPLYAERDQTVGLCASAWPKA